MSKWNRFGMGAILAVGVAAGGVLAGDLTPPGPPGATMKTLQEIYDKIDGIRAYVGDALTGEILSGKKAWVGGDEVIGTMANVGQQNVTPGTVEQAITQGYHNGTGAVAGDADLVAENIKNHVTIFGVTGTHTGDAGVPQTGQTASYQTGDDGAHRKGVAWPEPRLTNHGDGTVTDNLTGLMWVIAPHSLPGNAAYQTWNDAIDFCNGLTFAGYSDWRLPNVRELLSLCDRGSDAQPPLPAGHPFTGLETVSHYWSSTTYAHSVDRAWSIRLHYGVTWPTDKAGACNVWPVRAGL